MSLRSKTKDVVGHNVKIDDPYICQLYNIYCSCMSYLKKIGM